MDKEILEKIKQCRLMQGIENVEKLLHCFGAKIRSFEKGEQIVGYGDAPAIVIIVQGSAISLSEDWFGNRNIISRVGECGVFGAAYVYAGHEVTTRLEAAEACRAVFLSGQKIQYPCRNNCLEHTQFLCNAISLVSRSCVRFLEKVEHLSRRTMRDRVLSYLTEQAVKNGKNSFIIPFSRQELADYLAVDRSALSAELSRMKRDGLIDFKRSHFVLLKK